MKAVTLVKVTSVADAVTALKKGKAVIYAGGTDMLPELKGMISPNAPDTLVDIKTIPNLSYIKEEGGMLKIGPLTLLSDIANSSVVQGKYAALAQAAGRAASPELRNMGTIAGNICQHVRCWYYRAEHNVFSCLRKNPSGICYALIGDNRFHSIFGAVSGCIAVNPSDLAPALYALGAKIVTNKKTWDIKDFFAVNGESTTALATDEIITEIQVPTPAAGTKSAFMKFAIRKSFDFPIVNCAAAVTSAGGVVSSSTIVLNAVHNLPRRVTAAEDAIKGKAIDATSSDAAGTAAMSGAAPLAASGYNPGNKYMVQIAKIMVKRTVLACK